MRVAAVSDFRHGQARTFLIQIFSRLLDVLCVFLHRLNANQGQQVYFQFCCYGMSPIDSRGEERAATHNKISKCIGDIHGLFKNTIHDILCLIDKKWITSEHFLGLAKILNRVNKHDIDMGVGGKSFLDCAVGKLEEVGARPNVARVGHIISSSYRHHNVFPAS
jgi:hypothetical protein